MPRRAPPAGGDGALTKNGATCASATKQGALDAAWASMVADTPGVDASKYVLQRCGFYTEIQYKAICSSRRSFFYFTPPVGAQSVAAYITGVWHNFYASTTGPTFCPSWRAQLYTSATTPGTITSADWGFGTLRRSFTMPDVISGYTIATAYAWTGGPISGWTAGAMEYAQLRIEGDDTTIPQFVVTSGDWSAGGPAAYKGAAGSYYLRLLYSLV